MHSTLLNKPDWMDAVFLGRKESGATTTEELPSPDFSKKKHYIFIRKIATAELELAS
ncbi:hypothetical protein [Pedobacter changchengzhani]|uniref:hypothetical protein n=1 Tax=Pedobacter changchengzhani TaxID=2529274 RepID=UPI0014052C43|nr:hypothetical protein [Pedobacter changchengzhani]